jgi:predicted LPLAT superfamily acyltransferase
VARVIACGYFFFSHKRGESRRFYQRLFPDRSIFFHLCCTFRQYQNFTTIHLDRFLHGLGRTAHFTSTGWEHLEQAMGKGGAILLMSHLGNWEMAATLLRERKSDLQLLLYMGVKDQEVLEGAQKEGLRQRGVSIIGVDQQDNSPFSAVEALRVLERGGLVSMAADIVWRNDQRRLEVPFLGGTAYLPAAPFIFAQLSGAPLLIFFAFRIGTNCYHLPLSPPIFVAKTARDLRQQALVAAAREYTQLLEEALRRYPCQWYHFDRFVH